MMKCLTLLLAAIAVSDATGKCTVTFTKRIGLVSCDNITSEDYLASMFDAKMDLINSMSMGNIARISVDIVNSRIPIIDEWLFLPWDDPFIVIHSIKITNSSVNTVKPLSRLAMADTLNFSENNISDYRFLNKMKKLRFLHLNHNRFTSDSYLFTYLQKQQTRLELMDLSYCNLEYFGVITNLVEHYDLSFNPNLTLIEFNHTVDYRTPFLNLSGNNKPIVLKHLRAGKPFCLSLDLSNSNSSLDFLQLNSIHISETIYIKNNYIPSLDDNTLKLKNLISKKCLGRISVDISNSSVTQISSYFFNSYVLNVLNLSKNNLSTLTGSVFRKSDILFLDLSNSNISSISPSVFNYLSVNTLNLSKNNLSTLETIFDYVEKMKHLDASLNPIETLNSNVFKNCGDYLESLNLSGVFFKVLSHDTFLPLFSLKSLVLSFKNSVDSGSIKNPHVTELTIMNTTLSRLDAEQFKGFCKLRKLTFINSSALSIDNAAFKGLYNVKRIINLQEFGNYDISVFQHLNSLEHLDLSKHKLTKLNLELKDLQFLRKLNLSSNAIASVDVHSFASLKQLESLSLSHNELSTIAVGTFRNLNKLTHLYLNNNLLQQLVPGIFSGLEALFLLDLSHNDLLRIKPHLILGVSMPKLAYLYVQENGLGNEYAKSDDVLRRNEFAVIANHNKLKYMDINKNGWRCVTLIDILTLFKNRNITYHPTHSELTESNINGVTCTI